MKVGFFGTPEHARDLLKLILEAGHQVVFVVTNPDKPQGRKRELSPSPVKALALENEIPVFQPSNWKNEEDRNSVINSHTDIHIVYAYGKIIPEAIFQSPRLGSINLHGSLLPEFRGASPVQAAILSGKDHTGFTIQFLAKEVDSGAILVAQEFPIELEDTTGSILEKITDLGSKAILEILKKGYLPPAIPQDHQDASFCQKILSEDRIIDFSQPARMVHDRIRALYPNPIAYSHFRGKKIQIHSSYLPPDELEIPVLSGEQIPGRLIPIGKKSLFVICGDKKMIGIRELQPEGKKPMLAQDFLNGFSSLEGEFFT